MSNHMETYTNTGDLYGTDFGVFEVSGGLESTSSLMLQNFIKYIQILIS